MTSRHEASPLIKTGQSDFPQLSLEQMRSIHTGSVAEFRLPQRATALSRHEERPPGGGNEKCARFASSVSSPRRTRKHVSIIKFNAAYGLTFLIIYKSSSRH
jgi:hypothetical protein